MAALGLNKDPYAGLQSVENDSLQAGALVLCLDVWILTFLFSFSLKAS